MGALRGSDLRTVREQLGREPTTPFTVVARCPDGHPLVIRNRPLDVNGEPFPTLYWLTCPRAVKAVARLEAEGWIGRLNDRLQEDEAFDEALESAHRAYARERGEEVPGAESWGGVGGTRTGVKCLHAHYAYHLAGGDDPVGRWVAERVEPVHPEERPGRVAAIDQGTNSIRLLVAEPLEDGGYGELARDMVITRLGEGVDATGRLDPAALERTVEVLARYCRRARALHAWRIRVAATAAVREAGNREAFEAAVRTHAGAPLEVVSGEREAALSFLGATWRLEAPAPFLVLDIGGGSTELVLGRDRPLASASVRIGSVRLTERHVRHDPPTPEELGAIEADVDRALDEAEWAVPLREARTLVAVAGTATTVQALALGLPFYDPEAIHRSWLAREDAERVLLDLARMTTAERAALPVMAPG
ncbi:MAG TPA: DUF501 domain-containing protein, partial [Actinomycetota bacterium]|nr:DUF501 domain-containing protein [Actinomycetota bacterium]